MLASFPKQRAEPRLDEVSIGGQRAIIPSIEGSAYATGRNEIWIDDDDPFPHGFQVI